MIAPVDLRELTWRDDVEAGAWIGERLPDLGNLGRHALDTLLGLLGDPQTPCFFALWEDIGWIHGSPSVTLVGSDVRVPPELPRAVLDGLTLRLPHRDEPLAARDGPSARLTGPG